MDRIVNIELAGDLKHTWIFIIQEYIVLLLGCERNADRTTFCRVFLGKSSVTREDTALRCHFSCVCMIPPSHARAHGLIKGPSLIAFPAPSTWTERRMHHCE